MKKFSAILSLVLVICLLAGCAGTPVVYYADCTCPTEGGATEPAQPDETKAPEVTAEGEVKTGLAIVTSMAESVDGEAKYDVTIAAVNVDENGVIVGCYLDSLGTSVKFGADGVIITDVKA